MYEAACHFSNIGAEIPPIFQVEDSPPEMIRKAFLPLFAAGGVLTATALPAAGPAPDGAALFRQRCASCHVIAPGARPTIGPNLNGVVGRKAASTAFSYSDALKASKLTWSRANLDRFITSPGQMVPGTRMVIGISDTQQRAAVLNFLAHPTP